MASIIKAHEHPSDGRGAAFHLDELAGEAVAPGSGAASRAADVLSRAAQQAGEIRRRAEEEGRAAGLLVAEQVLSERIDRQMTASIAAVTSIQAARDEWLAHWERTAVHVAVKIAERVIRREVANTPQITLALVREALELAAGGADIKLRMNPDDAKALAQHADRLAKELTHLGKVELVADPAIASGGCRVDTRFGVIDQQFASQLARIESELA
jgi:flagellar assembly protein FliH